MISQLSKLACKCNLYHCNEDNIDATTKSSRGGGGPDLARFIVVDLAAFLQVFPLRDIPVGLHKLNSADP